MFLAKSWATVFLLLWCSSIFAQMPKDRFPGKLPGQMVDIGGYKLHIDCVGNGSPAVIFENGLGDIFSDWALVQPKIAAFTRACSYDRAYEGFSDAGPIPITMHQQVFELHLLLEKAGIPGPYILVGHSYGGMVVQQFTVAYPHEVAGLVLVDSLHEDTKMGDKMFRSRATGKAVPAPQTMKTSPPLPFTPQEQAFFEKRTKQLRQEAEQPVSPPLTKLPAEALRFRQWAHAHPKFESTSKGLPEEWLAEELQVFHDWRTGKVHPFGELPLIVIGTTRDNPGSFEERKIQLDDMASLSTNSKVMVDENSGHHVQWDDPQFVIDAIRQVYDAAKNHIRVGK